MFSQHAITRMQQRGISDEAVPCCWITDAPAITREVRWSISTAACARRCYSPGGLAVLNVTASAITIWCWGMDWW